MEESYNLNTHREEFRSTVTGPTTMGLSISRRMELSRGLEKIGVIHSLHKTQSNNRFLLSAYSVSKVHPHSLQEMEVYSLVTGANLRGFQWPDMGQFENQKEKKMLGNPLIFKLSKRCGRGSKETLPW